MSQIRVYLDFSPISRSINVVDISLTNTKDGLSRIEGAIALVPPAALISSLFFVVNAQKPPTPYVTPTCELP